ncbi:hypothetical protein PGB34_09830 [Xenophilus arseniciresistens]|uniref:Uncharacterized protein n=1 Tax=Xenophilus arseniciresistens TaxID=1283306 RepID=A0AAE3T0U2_9BURK|nr:hypothetical protein [Xenophilus arseniciresistens]MDA7416662.1 hypothetical protein [Xenophilus arseniciresistens]
MLGAAVLLLGACSPRPPTSQFHADLCGRAVSWEQKSDYWDALYTGQLPGQRELTIALSIPRQAPTQPDQPIDELNVQFNLQGEPGLLQADGAPKLVGRFPLRANDLFKRAEESADPSALRRAELGAGAAAAAAPGPELRTGMATVFGDNGVMWKGGEGELQITEVRVVARDDEDEGGGGSNGGVAIASGSYRFDATPAGSGMACVISGTFKDASFRLRP